YCHAVYRRLSCPMPFLSLITPLPRTSTLCPYTTLFRSRESGIRHYSGDLSGCSSGTIYRPAQFFPGRRPDAAPGPEPYGRHQVSQGERVQRTVCFHAGFPDPDAGGEVYPPYRYGEISYGEEETGRKRQETYVKAFQASGMSGSPFFLSTGNEIVIRSEEHTSELQSRFDLVYRLLLE